MIKLTRDQILNLHSGDVVYAKLVDGIIKFEGLINIIVEREYDKVEYITPQLSISTPKTCTVKLTFDGCIAWVGYTPSNIYKDGTCQYDTYIMELFDPQSI